MVIRVRATSSSLNWSSIESRICPAVSGRELEMAARGAMGEKGRMDGCEAKENLYVVLYPRRGF